MQLLALYVLNTTSRQCENLTQDILMKKLQISQTEFRELIQLLHDEHVIRYKYTFQCPKCQEMDTIYEYENNEGLCHLCGKTIDTKSLIDGATVRFVLNKEDFIEFMDESFSKELESARKGEYPTQKVLKFTQNNNSIGENIMTSELIENRLFISHSSKDVKYVEAFVEFLEDLGVPSKKIFCSSIYGHKIAWGNNIYDYLANEFTTPNKNLIVLFMLSDNYYKSIPCLNEMGATWVSKKEYRSILLPGFEYNKIEGAIDANNIGVKLDAPDLKYELNEIKEQMTDWFNLNPIDENKWDRIRDHLIENIK